DHLATDLGNLVREGAHRLWLDLSAVTYLSSLGLGVLVRFQTQLRSLGGSLKVVNPSEPVREVLDTTRLTALLVGESPGGPGRATWELRAPRRGEFREQGRIALEFFKYPTAGPFQGRLVGDPALLRGCRFGEADCPTVPLGADAVAVGVGALGR